MYRYPTTRFFFYAVVILLVLQSLPVAPTQAATQLTSNVVTANNLIQPLAAGPKTSSLPAINTPYSGIISVTTRGNDVGRTGALLNETVLSTTNVTSATFGKLFQRVVDGDIYAQPLYLSNLTIGYIRNVVFVATQHNSVYAFDADDPNASAPLWQVSLGTSAKNATSDYGLRYGVPYHDIQKEVGITSTPVIDAAGGTMYVLSFACVTNDLAMPPQYCDPATVTPPAPRYYHHYLHALDVKTGAEKFGGPVRIDGQVDGNGAGSTVITVTVSPLVTKTVIPFVSKQHLQRPGLAFVNGNIYLAFSGFADTNPYHGWVMVYDPYTLGQTGIWNTTPTSGAVVPGNNDKDAEGGIWQSGQGLTADNSGNLYVMMGNGTFDADTNTNPDPKLINYADSFVKLDTRHNDVVPIDWFAPNCQLWMQSVDADLGSSGPVAIPGTNLLVGAGKQGNIYVLNQANLGRYHPPGGTITGASCADNAELAFIPDRINNAVNGGLYAPPVFWNSPAGKRIYVWGTNDWLKSYQMNSATTFTHTAVVTGTTKLTNSMPGGMLSLSANGNTPGSGIIWATHSIAGSANASTKNGILRAYNAETLVELWNSEMIPGRDSLNSGDGGSNLSYLAKFNPATVGNGKVYVATFAPGGTTLEPSLNVGKPAFLMVYGLLASQVTKANDDNTLNSLSYALTHSPPNQIISLAPSSGSVINVTTTLPVVPPGVTLKGFCNATGPGITIQYTQVPPVAGTDGLVLTGKNIWLYGIKVRAFPGVQLKAPVGGDNVVNCVKATKT